MKDYTDRWNNLTFKEKSYLLPHFIESQILHYEQCKIKIIEVIKET